MSKTTIRIRIIPAILLLFAFAAPWPATFAATTAGRVVFATGNPVATDAAGAERSLSRGNDVFAGDDLRTPVNSRLQVSFVDGGFISLQPDSEYRIDEYRWSGKPDGTESAVYHLIKGGIRAVTGLIGKEHHDSYKVVTAAATIGIRGTGFNTRICHGDCAGRADGLYHSTWEGITYVRNNTQEVNVPTGRGVYVRDINSSIQFLSQPPVVTAVQTARQKEQEQKQHEEQTQVPAAGDQRTATGDQTVIVGEQPPITPTGGKALSGKGLFVVVPNSDTSNRVDLVSGDAASIFLNGGGQVIGALLTEDNGSGATRRTVGTLDLDNVLGSDTASAVQEVNSLLAQADTAQVALFRQHPATVAESTVLADGIGWARWSGGNVLSFNNTGETNVDVLSGYQSIHFIFGTPAQTLPGNGFATYNFLGGTRSTSLSGATIGSGVTDGYLYVDFGAGDGGISMTVSHGGNSYLVAGPLGIDALNHDLQTDNIIAITSAPRSACNPYCPTLFNAGFAQPYNGTGAPRYVGIAYGIEETDLITGVAAFGSATGAGSTRVNTNLVFSAVAPSPTPPYTEATLGTGAAGFFNSANLVIGALYTDGNDGLVHLVSTDINAVLTGNDLVSVSAAATLLSQADPALLTQVQTHPAVIAEMTIGADGAGWGRWTGGNILSISAGGSADVQTLTGNQSAHFIFGQEPSSIPNTGTATYNFAGGTRSTSASGATIGSGVTGGSINVDFGAASATLNMNVSHASNTYTVAGPLGIDAANDHIFDTGSVTAATSAPGSACYPSCTTNIEGGFAGPMTSGASPLHVGIGYQIRETDPITGVAGFNNISP